MCFHADKKRAKAQYARLQVLLPARPCSCSREPLTIELAHSLYPRKAAQECIPVSRGDGQLEVELNVTGGTPSASNKEPIEHEGWRLHLLTLYQQSDPAKCPAHQCQDSFLRGFGFTGPSAPRVHLQSYEKGYAAMPDRHRQPRTSLGGRRPVP